MSKIIENYLLTETVGQGQYGKVYKATHKKQENKLFAIKTIKLDKFKTVPQLNQFTLNEIQTLAKINHINIIKFVEMLRSSNNVYMVYEFCSGGTLEDKIKQRKNGLDESYALSVIAQIVKAFQVLSKEHILHRDLKPQNILFDDEENVKIADFGFCKTLRNKNSMTQTMVGSPIYMSPEVLKGQPYNTKNDVWSLGAVLFEMIFGFCPYEEKTIALLIQKIHNYKLHIPRNKKQISAECEQLIHQMLCLDQRQRIDWFQLYNHPVLKPYIQQADIKENNITTNNNVKQNQENQNKLQRQDSRSTNQTSNYNSQESNNSSNNVLQDISNNQNNNTMIDQQQQQKQNSMKEKSNNQKQQNLESQKKGLEQFMIERESIIQNVQLVNLLIKINNSNKYIPQLSHYILKKCKESMQQFKQNGENISMQLDDVKKALEQEMLNLEQLVDLLQIEIRKINTANGGGGIFIQNQQQFNQKTMEYIEFSQELNKLSLQGSVQQSDCEENQKSQLQLLVKLMLYAMQEQQFNDNKIFGKLDQQETQNLFQDKLNTFMKYLQDSNNSGQGFKICDNEIKQKIQSFDVLQQQTNNNAIEMKSPLY